MMCALLGASGQTQAALGEHQLALSAFDRQRKVARKFEARDYEAESLMLAGTSYGALGRLHNAESSWRRAVEIFELLGDPRAGEIRRWLA